MTAPPTKRLTFQQLAALEGGDGPLAFALQREVEDLCYVVSRFTVDGDPVTKSRARWDTRRGGRPFTPEHVKVAERKVAWLYRQATGGQGQPDGNSSFGVFVGFFCATGQRRDVDNMLKLVMDALTGAAWVDDAQVAEISAKVKRFQGQDARTEVVIYHTVEANRPTRRCDHCGEKFATYPSQQVAGRTRRFCNRECGYAWRRAQNKRTCEGCGKDFQAASPDAKFCSKTCASTAKTVEVTCRHCSKVLRRPQSIANRGASYCDNVCRAAHWRDHRKVAAKGTCSVCGGPTSKKSYTRCRACHLDGGPA